MIARELWRRLAYPFRKARLDRELREEMELHVALRAEQLRDDHGVSAADALSAARKQFGNASRIAGASRDAWGWPWLDGFGQDLRYVLRQLRRTPTFAAVAALTIALGVGINAAAFTFYDAIVLKPLPVTEPARMVRVVRNERVLNPAELTWTAYDVVRRASTTDAVLALTGPQALAAVLPGHTESDQRFVNVRFVSPDFFRALGVRAQIGRAIDATDDMAIVVDHGFWRTALDADPSVIGRRISFRGIAMTIVGIAPETFAGTGQPAVAPDLWLPMSALPTLLPGTDWRHDDRPHWQILARLAPNVTLQRFSAELSAMSPSIPDSAGKPTPLVAKRATFFQTDAGEFEVFQQASVAFMVALALILGIAIVNLVNLFAARNTSREREVTVRLALGANRARITRQLASESLLLAVVGGAIGLGASHVFAQWVRAWLIGTMASITGGAVGVFLDLSTDWRVAIYASGLSIAIGCGVGLWPALRAARSDVNSVLRQGTSSTASGAAWAKRNVLLAAQIAGCLVLLTAAGMLLAGMQLSREVDPKFDASHLLVVEIDLSASPDQRALIRADVQRRLAELPQVRAVAWTQRIPFLGTHLRRAQTAEGDITISIDDVSETYFDAMDIPIIRGRSFTSTEVAARAPVMLVSEALARRRWPGQDPVGRSVPPNDVLSGPDTTARYTVIGVVRDVRTNFLSRTNAPSTYYAQDTHGPFGGFLVRTRGAPESAINDVRLAVAAVSPTLLPGTHIASMERGPMALQRLMAQAPATIALALALAGLALAAVGVYGLVAQIVARRTREIGIHVALGARPAQVIALVARKTLRPVAWGAAIGAVGAVGVSAVLRSVISTPDAPDLTFGAGAFNPIVFLGVLATLAIVVVVACYVPARRAAMVDPMDALRSD